MKKWVRWRRIGYVVFILVFPACVFGVNFFSEFQVTFAQQVICGLIFFLLMKLPARSVETEYEDNLLQKSDFLGNAIGFFPGFSSEKNKGDLSRYELDCLPEYDAKLSQINTSITGEYKKVKLLLENVSLKKETINSKKQKVVNTVCAGWFIWIEFNKNFSGKTTIRPDFIPGFDQSSIKTRSGDYQKVELEDVAFESKFNVYSTDQIESRYLITTSFMERLQEVGNSFAEVFVHQFQFPAKKREKAIKFYGKCIFAFFCNNHLLISPIFSANGLKYKISLFQKLDFVDAYRSVVKQMNAVFKIIDVLKLNQKIGL